MDKESGNKGYWQVDGEMEEMFHMRGREKGEHRGIHERLIQLTILENTDIQTLNP